MPRISTSLRTAALSAICTAILSGAAFAGSTAYSAAANYNTPYGMTAGEENAAINPTMRDSSNNLSIVNGQVTSANFGMASSGVQSMSTISSSSLTTYGTASAYAASSSSSTSATGAGSSTATAIGNSLNVVTVGSNNTVIVNSVQTNNGDQTATITNK